MAKAESLLLKYIINVFVSNQSKHADEQIIIIHPSEKYKSCVCKNEFAIWKKKEKKRCSQEDKTGKEICIRRKEILCSAAQFLNDLGESWIWANNRRYASYYDD